MINADKEATTKKTTTKKSQRTVVTKTRTEAKDKAEKEVFGRYVKVMGPAASATASKLKSESMKKQSAAKNQTDVDDCLIKVGQRVSGR